MELLGLLSLLGQRLPDALAELLTELRAQAKVSADYYGQVDARLALSPRRSPLVWMWPHCRSMGEAFRQQLAATGLQDASALLRASSGEITALSGQIAAALKPVTHEYQKVSATITSEVAKLSAASREILDNNAQLIVQERSSSWMWRGMLALVLFLLGGLCGIVIEKRQTTYAVLNVGTVSTDSNAYR